MCLHKDLRNGCGYASFNHALQVPTNIGVQALDVRNGMKLVEGLEER